MSIELLDIQKYIQNFDIFNNNKEIFGEVHTDFSLIYKILNLIPNKEFKNPNKKWLDPCAGRGYFMIILYKKLFFSLRNVIKNNSDRHNHIIQNMIYMIEINPQHILNLYELFGEKANILNDNFLFTSNQKYDFIIGNPPFNINGAIKVPTQNKTNKKGDGKMIWAPFILHSINSLHIKGFLAFITPSIWMKKDHFMFKKITQYKLKKLHTLTNTETNKIFHGQAQTPTCYFLIQKLKIKNPTVYLFNKASDNYIKFHPHKSIPLCGASIFKKLQSYVERYKSIKVIKTNMPKKHLKFSPNYNKNYPYKNIKTCHIKQLSPTLVINYSNVKSKYSDIPKLILAHKMYGFPFLDEKGEFGISNRDNYIIINKTLKEFQILKQFLSTKFALYLFEATRYRMSYLEKYVFEMIPDVSEIKEFPIIINDTTIASFFNLSPKERIIINNFHNKNYTFF
jgi:tRNA1(Val) A37 N6-methylase TrmN6